MPINQVLLSNTFNEFRTTVNEITDVVNDLTANVLSGQIVANTISVGQVSSNLIPSANITYDLGSSTNRWNDLYLSGNTIYLGDAEIKYENGEVTFTAEGNVIPVANINASNITSGTLSADRLATSGVAAGGYGSASQVPVLVIDSKGRVTSAANVNVAGVTDFDYYSGNSNFVIYTADGGSFSATIGQDLSTGANVTFNKVTVSAAPTTNSDLANKAYVDEVAEGLQTKPAVEIATTGNLAATYNNGTLGVGATLTANTNGAFPEIDGITLSSIILGENGVLVKNQSNAAQNGRYNLTTVGNGSTPWVLTRCGLCDEKIEIPGAYVFVKRGTLYAGTGWVQTVADPTTFTVGTDAITVTQFSGVGSFTAGTGLALNGTEFRLANTDVTAGGYGSASQIPVLVIDAQGRITSSANVSVAGVSAFVYHTSNTTFSIYTAANTAFNAQVDGSGFSALNASNVTSGTLANARTTANTVNSANSIVLRDANGSFSSNVITATTFSGNGVNITFLNATNIGTGLVPTARLATGTANNETYLRGDQTWQPISAGGLTVTNDTSTNSNGYYPTLTTATTGSISAVNTSSTKLYFNPSAGQLNATTFNSLSDLNLKKNVTKITNATELVKLLEGFEFEWKDNDKKSSGVIAQYIEKVLPHLVDDDNNQKTVNYSGLIAYLIEAVKELNTRLEKIESK